MRRTFFPLILTFLLAACDLSASDEVELRVENGSNVDFASVRVGVEGGSARLLAEYGPLMSGEVSNYRPVIGVYSQAAAIAETADGKIYEIYVSYDRDDLRDEGGRHTYHLMITDGRLEMTLSSRYN